ncbi:MAG: hypothetical protein RSE01_05555, partial [Akkermansia sp.]
PPFDLLFFKNELFQGRLVTDKLKIHLPFSCLATFYFFSRFLFRTGVNKNDLPCAFVLLLGTIALV